jgi:ribosome maturation factor RimP
VNAKTQEKQHRAERDLAARVESCLAASEPEVDVLAVEVIGQGRSAVLRLFIDHPAGVNHELCAHVTHQLRDLLSEYSVEVSSPGPARPLTKPEHYRRFIGRAARVRTTEPIDGRSEFKGELIDAGEQGIVLSGEWGRVAIPHDRIRRSNLVPQPIAIPKAKREKVSGGVIS